MKKKRNEYKPKRNKKLFKNILTAVGTLALAYIFIVIGYSVAKPFGEIGETKPTEFTAETTQTAAVNSTEPKKADRIYRLKDQDIDDIGELDTKLKLIEKKNYSIVSVPLKISGGKLNYSSSFEGAALADVGNELSLSDICSTVESNGFEPAATINALDDNLYPNSNTDSGFKARSTKKLWYDKQSSDGKPWLDPASTETKNYLSAITGEITKAGFKKIICTGVKYPSFSADALEDIEGSVSKTDRYLDLVDDVNTIADSSVSKGGEVWLELSAYDLLRGEAEVFTKPNMLKSSRYVISIELDKFRDKLKLNGKEVDFGSMSIYDKLKTICKSTEKNIYRTSFIPQIDMSSMNFDQKQEVSEALKKLGYDSCIVIG